MKREHYLARVFRALSGRTQGEMAEEIGVNVSNIGQIEQGQVVPSAESLRGMASAAGLTVADGEEILTLADTLRKKRLRPGVGIEDLLDEAADTLRSQLQSTFRRLLTLPLPGDPPKPEDRREAAELFAQLQGLEDKLRSTVVRVSGSFQVWALCEKVCDESLRETSTVEEAAGWARLAQEIAERVRGTEEWRNRLQGYAAAHAAKALQRSGDSPSAAVAFEESLCLWNAGSDPGGLLDPGRMPALEATLKPASSLNRTVLGPAPRLFG
jgi:transcriptional regulator with XRE-family HTH domain